MAKSLTALWLLLMFTHKLLGRDCAPLYGTRQTTSRYCIQFWAPTQQRSGQTARSLGKPPTVVGLEHLPHEERLGELD